MKLTIIAIFLLTLGACTQAEISAGFDAIRQNPRLAVYVERAADAYCPFRVIGSPAADVLIPNPITREPLRMSADELCDEYGEEEPT